MIHNHEVPGSIPGPATKGEASGFTSDASPFFMHICGLPRPPNGTARKRLTLKLVGLSIKFYRTQRHGGTEFSKKLFWISPKSFSWLDVFVFVCALGDFLVLFAPVLRQIARYLPHHRSKNASKTHPKSSHDKFKTASKFFLRVSVPLCSKLNPVAISSSIIPPIYPRATRSISAVPTRLVIVQLDDY